MKKYFVFILFLYIVPALAGDYETDDLNRRIIEMTINNNKNSNLSRSNAERINEEAKKFLNDKDYQNFSPSLKSIYDNSINIESQTDNGYSLHKFPSINLHGSFFSINDFYHKLKNFINIKIFFSFIIFFIIFIILNKVSSKLFSKSKNK